MVVRFYSARPAQLCCALDIIVDLGGFFVSRGVTHASEGEWKAVPDLLKQLLLPPVSLAGDTENSVGQLRELLGEQGITAYIPIHSRQDTSMVTSGDFIHHGDRLICPQGKILRRGAYRKRQQPTFMWRVRQACPTKETCPPPGQKRRFFSVTIYQPVYSRARERNRTAAHQRERFRRQAIAEGTFASLDRLGWDKSRLRGPWKVGCEGYMAALAHNVKKMVRRLGGGVGPPSPAAPADAIAASAGNAAANFPAPVLRLLWVSWWAFYPKLALR